MAQPPLTVDIAVHRQWEAIACLSRTMRAALLLFLGDQYLHSEPERRPLRLARGAGGLVPRQPCVVALPPFYELSILCEFP